MKNIVLFFLLLLPGICHAQTEDPTLLKTVDYAETYQYLQAHPNLIYNEESIPLKDFIDKFYLMEGVWIDSKNNNQVHMKGEVLPTTTKPETLRLINAENKPGTYVYFEEEKGQILVKTMSVNRSSSSFSRRSKGRVQASAEEQNPQKDSVLHYQNRHYKKIQKDFIIYPDATK